MRLETIFEKAVPDPAQGMPPMGDPEGLQTQPIGGGGDEGMPPAEEPAIEEPAEGEDTTPGVGKDESTKAASAIDAVEKLRSAAAGLDAASFAIKTDYSDFSLAERIDQVKQELLYIINKAREHVEYSAAKDPQAKQKVAQWLNT